MKLKTKREIAAWAGIIPAAGLCFIFPIWGYIAGVAVGLFIYDYFVWLGEWSA